MIIIRILGFFYLILRLWLTEKKLVKELDFQRHFMSRTSNIFLGIVLVSNFEAFIFNFIVLTILPVMVISLSADIRFFIRLHNNYFEIDEENKKWLFIERITLHIPLIFIGFFMFLSGVENFFNKESLLDVLIVAPIIMYSSWFLLDKRAYDPKYLPIFRNIMTLLVTISLTFTINYVWVALS